MPVDPAKADAPIRIDYVEFTVRDVAEAKRFYGELFNWTFEDYGPDYAAFNDGNLNGGFAKAPDTPDTPATQEASDPAAAPFARRRGTLIVLYTKDLDALQSRIRAAGGRIVRETFSFPGGKRFHFTDPAGNELAVWSEA